MAKLDARRVGAFLADPGGCRVALLHGDDPGLIRERAEALVRGVADGDALATGRDRHARRCGRRRCWPNEAASPPLTGGRCLVRAARCRRWQAGRGCRAKAALAGPGPGLVVMEAPELRTSAALFKAVEASAQPAR